jgi:ATP-binding cassette subfamily F protein 3
VLEFRDLSIHYGIQQVLEHVDLRINAGERVGIVGPNGAGKSTLFQLIMGDRLPDGGSVRLDGRHQVGYVRQHLAPAHDEETLLEYALRGVPRLHDMERQLHELGNRAARCADEAERERLLRQAGALQSEFEHLGGYRLEARVKASLGGLGFAPEDFDRPFLAFSGGWQMRAELARVLAADPDLLLLDEPSNYLDLPAVEWLQRQLRGFDGTLLLISHDRYLLRSLTGITVEVDAGTATRYAGGLDFYLREREVRYATLAASKANQDRQRAQIQRFVERFKATSTKASQAQSKARQLERMEEIRLPTRSRAAAYLRLPRAPHSGAEMVRLEGAGYTYDGVRTVLRDVDLAIGRGEKLAIVGYNGMGKTTLLRLLAGVREPTTGRRVPGHKVIPGYQSQEFAETMDPEVTVFGHAKTAAPGLTERELRTCLGSFGFGEEDVGKPAGVLSGGERIRLAFLRLFLAPPNLMLLDEPTTHLDLEGRQTLERLLKAYDGTVCLVSHDVAFVRAVADGIIEISPAGVRRFPGGYDYYREKTGREEREGLKEPDKSDRSDSSDKSSRDLRRARAQVRARSQGAIAELRRRVEAYEYRIGKLEAEQKQLADELSAGGADLDYAGKSSRLKSIQAELGRYSAEWEEGAEELERLQREMTEAQARVG